MFTVYFDKIVDQCFLDKFLMGENMDDKIVDGK